MDDSGLHESLFGDLDQAHFEEHAGQENTTEGLDNFLDSGSVSYAPSVAQTDFSEHLPVLSNDPELELSKHYNVSAVVGSAWTSLQSEVPKLPWEQGFWNDFLDPTKSALDCLHGSYKRPVPYHYEGVESASSNPEVERRVVARTFPGIQGFLKHIRDVPEKSWQEERDAQWEIAIRRWVAVLDECHPGETLLLHSLHSCTTFTEKAQILVDVFFNKAPQTLVKRVNSLSRLCNGLSKIGLKFPCDEEAFYKYLKTESQNGAPSSRLKACFEAVVFARHVLGIECLQSLITSRRCLGAASQQGPTCPKQASPFTVAQIKRFHEVLRDGTEMWDRAMAGMLLFCIYARARWSDA